MDNSVNTLSGSVSSLASRTVGAHPVTYGAVLVAFAAVIIILAIAIMVEKSGKTSKKGSFLGTSPYGNLNTGGNNPMWHHQMGDGGWGGPMHSTYQGGQSRVWGASAEGGHDGVVVPRAAPSCGGGAGPVALDEVALGVTLAGAGSARGMSDDELTRVMNGSGAGL